MKTKIIQTFSKISDSFVLEVFSNGNISSDEIDFEINKIGNSTSIQNLRRELAENLLRPKSLTLSKLSITVTDND